MIKNSDTLLYKEEMEIRDGDTVYLGTCWTFEKVNGQIINQRDQNCLPQGHWIITDSLGNYQTGDYRNGKSIGLWKKFDKTGKLLKETEYISEVEFESIHNEAEEICRILAKIIITLKNKI